MDNPSADLDLASSECITIPSNEQFVEILSRLPSPKDRSFSDVVFKLLLTPDKCNIVSNETKSDTSLYTPDELEDLKKRYQAMLVYLSNLVDQKFTILKLEIATKLNIAGTSIEFLAPSGKKYTHEYFRIHHATTLIPDDFLYDLQKFPSRNL